MHRAPHCDAADVVPTPVQNEPALAISASIAVEYSYFTLIFHKAVTYGSSKVMGNPHLQQSWKVNINLLIYGYDFIANPLESGECVP